MGSRSERPNPLLPEIATERLDIYRTELDRPHNAARTMWMAFVKAEIGWRMAGHLLVMQFSEGAAFVEWISIDPQFRRMGLATEMLQAIDVSYPCELMLTAATEEGKAFIDAYQERFAKQ